MAGDEPGEIDLWWFRHGCGATAGQAALGPLDRAERQRFRAFGCAGAARFFAFRRAARRVILARYARVAPGSLAFREAPGGKPLIVHPSVDLWFSVSHSGRIGVVAVSGAGPVGVDVEAERPLDPARLAEGVLSPAERLTYQRVDAAGRNGLILRAWTGKEALVKGLGLGLDLGAFRQVTLDLSAAPEEWQEIGMGGRLAGEGRWHLYPTTLPAAGETTVVICVVAQLPRMVRVLDAAPLLGEHDLA